VLESNIGFRNHNTANGILGDAVHRLFLFVIYFQNIFAQVPTCQPYESADFLGQVLKKAISNSERPY